MRHAVATTHSLTAFWSFMTAALFCVGMAYGACVASNPQSSTFGGRAVTEGFGANDSGVHAGANHNGVDLRTRDNPTVTAYFGGTVTAGQMNGYGNTVMVTNGNIRAIYGHASNGGVSVSSGQTVSAGQALGDWSGTSGHSTGAHLHLSYEVNNNGAWTSVDPIEVQKLIDGGMDPNSAGFAQAAVTATTDRCNMSADQLHTSTGSPTGSTGAKVCDDAIRADVSAQLESAITKKNDFVKSSYSPPPPLSQVSNNPCASKELQRISNQFAYAPSRYSQQLTGGLLSAAGPVAGIMQNMFKSEFQSINSAAASIPKMLNFQSMASGVLGNLMSSLGLGDAFSSQICGLMVDMVLKYIQCENPIKLPDLGNMFGSLNNLLPKGCAGEALRSGLYAAGNMSALKSINQPVNITNGSVSLGTAGSTSSSGSTGSPITMPTGLQIR